MPRKASLPLAPTENHRHRNSKFRRGVSWLNAGRRRYLANSGGASSWCTFTTGLDGNCTKRPGGDVAVCSSVRTHAYATLAAIVIFYSIGLIKPAEFVAIRKVRTMEFRWALLACLGVLIWGALHGIVVAIILSSPWPAKPPIPECRLLAGKLVPMFSWTACPGASG